jgi:hypothetical protein
MIKDCPITKRKGKRPTVLTQCIKKIEEDDYQEENDTPTDDVEEEDTQDFTEGDV